MADEKVVYVQGRSNVVGILAIVFAILGIFFLGFVFVPLAFLLTIITTIQAVKRKDTTSIIIAVLAWIFVFVGLMTSPMLLALISFGGSW